MKQGFLNFCLIFCLIAGTQLSEAWLADIPPGIDVSVEEYLIWIGLSPAEQEEKREEHSKNRLLSESETGTNGPCAGFDFADQQTCGEHPELNPSLDNDYALSIFARDWIEYTCCQITKEPMHGIISTVWLWLQVCNTAVTTALSNTQHLLDDNQYSQEEMTGVPYVTGPLKVMYYYCPQDLDSHGHLSEWVVATFFPVIEDRNPNFHAFQESVDNCAVDEESTGAVTVLLTEPVDTETRRSFGHIAMVLHEDPVSLALPDSHDQDNFVSWSNHGNTIGAMITGTKAVHVGFGQKLENVTHTITLYNADTQAMLEKWQDIRTNGQMFDLMEWNCARTLFEVLNEGYKKCQVPVDELWTPDRAYKLINEKLKTKINAGVIKPQVSVESIREAQIVAPVEIINTGIDPALVIGICLACFFGTLILATAVATAIILKIKADASQQLDRNLANLLISAASNPNSKGGMPAIAEEGAGGASGPPSKKKGKKNSVAPIPLSASIQQEMDVGTTDGKTDYPEFMKWAKDHGFNFKAAKILWSELDRDHNNHVTNKEWEKYIEKRPNLKWLATRIQSVARK